MADLDEPTGAAVHLGHFTVNPLESFGDGADLLQGDPSSTTRTNTSLNPSLLLRPRATRALASRSPNRRRRR
jgi:hypothetical protein